MPVIFAIFSSQSYSQNITQLEYKRETVISVDYLFNNEGLNKPVQIEYSPSYDMYVVLDIGNTCLYVFDEDFKFVRKTSRIGQGPGELLGPKFFSLNPTNSNIYVYEGGNKRISIFSMNGEFLDSFRINLQTDQNLEIMSNGTILVNDIKREYYITQYSIEGEGLKSIGEIGKSNFADPGSLSNYKGNVFYDDRGYFYIHIHRSFILKKFDEYGNIIQNYSLASLFGFSTFDDLLMNKDNYIRIFTDIQYKNGKFYFLQRRHVGREFD